MKRTNVISDKITSRKDASKSIIKINLANRITLARILAVPIFIIILCADFRYSTYVAALFFTILALSDFVDGYVARKYNQVTAVGAMLDPLADKLLVSSALIFLIGRGVDAWMVYVILARELIITGLRSMVMRDGGSMPAKVSGKLKTLSQIIAVLAVILDVQYAWYIMLMATIITIYSGLEYLWIERKILKDLY